MPAPPTDIRQISVSRVTLGVIISTSLIAGTIAWSTSRLVARIDHLEDSVAAIEEMMDLQAYARVDDVSDDFDAVWLQLAGLEQELEGVKDSVGVLLMGDEQSFWAED